MTVSQRLMVVAEDGSRLEEICSWLRDNGFHATGFSDPQDALVDLGGHTYDILLIESGACSFDRAALAQNAAAIQPEIVAALVGDEAGDPSGADPAEISVLEFLPWPFVPGALRRMVARAMQLRMLRQQLAMETVRATASTTRLEATLRDRDAFAGRIAHDLQAVMQANEGFATALLHRAGAKLDDKEQHYLQRIVDTSLRGNRLVNDLVAYERLGNQEVHLRPVALAQVLERAREGLAPDCAGRDIEWTIGGMPMVCGDASLLQHAFVHLLSNALKFTRGVQPARIRVEASCCEHGHEIRVVDNGAGFDANYAHTLFRPFERLHPIAEFEGSGMGLANFRRIIERHGGTVRAEALKEGGALFAFTLASAQASDAGARPPAAPRESTEPPQRGSPALRVLLIDDDPAVLTTLGDMLEYDGQHVTRALGGPAGVATFARSLEAGPGFDLVITDFGMPHMDGGEVARRVKATSPGTTVFLLTGWGARLDASDDWCAKVDEVLAKPPRLADVRKALSKVTASAA
ncbi:response regulator [Ramlibacter ginsenosidimutans]|uniref:histidine kinase n=1 Tax=Ramlibacter ginsenosidimutans TaxID=502333 RepID=A0A934TTS4_9BURK|nr:ATP-binding protein [Ramlibacter ginsenosidimutans]MBK6007243.1 response regulator [Ramlibacter ginsenosidimutans]